MYKRDYREGPGIDVIPKFGGANFEVASLTFHNHLGDEDEVCSYRYGVIVTILGIGIIFGWFRTFEG